MSAHGSGVAHGVMSELLVATRLIDGKGNVVVIDDRTGENSDLLPAVRVSLGALGIYSTVTLKVD